MAIRYRCPCGIQIKMPESAAGKRAKCKSCGRISIVPAPKNAVADKDDEPVTWLEEFAKEEAQAQAPASVMKLDLPEPPIEKTQSPPVLELQNHEYHSPDEERSGIKAPEIPFWRDLIASFTFFANPNNLIVFIIIIFVYLVSLSLPLIPAFTPYVMLFKFLLMGVVYGYLCAFFMTVILEVASGEDELPTVSISHIYVDLFSALLRFLCSWGLVLLPATSYSILAWYSGHEISWPVLGVLAATGIFLWPAVILGVSIGGGFQGLWPHIIIRTVISAFLPYIAIWAILIIAFSLVVFPLTDYFAILADRIASVPTLSITMIEVIMTTYAMIVSMRAIGLFYRHYKSKFPWKAE